MPNNHPNIYILYHAHCADGFGAAWATHKRLGDHHEGSKVHYLPVSYGEPPPEMERLAAKSTSSTSHSPERP